MKTLENFFEKAHLFKVFLFGWASSGILFALVPYILLTTGGTRPELGITGTTCLQMGAILGILGGLLSVLMIGQMRKRQVFWMHAKAIESLIDKAESKAALESIRKHGFESLREMSQGGPHNNELYRLHAIMQTKYKYVK